MKTVLHQTLCRAALLCAISIMASAQIAEHPAAPAAQITPFEILSFKIVSYYNPLLERSGVTGADTRELPRTPSEQVSNANRGNNRSHQERANEVGVPPGAAPSVKALG